MSPGRLRHALMAGPAIISVVLHAPAVQAEIQPRIEKGQLVYTSRPDKKPGTGTSGGERRASAGTAGSMQRLIRDVSDRYRLDPGLVSAVISVESGFDPSAVSPKGARGLMQLMPATAREYGVKDVHDPRQNIEGGVAYLSDLTRRYDGNLKLALAAYNAGPTAVGEAGGVPGFPETIQYLERIEARYGKSLSRKLPTTGPGRIRTSVDESGHVLVTNRPGRRGRARPRH